LKLVKIIETARETSARLATLSEKDRTGSSGRRVMVSIRLDQSQTYQTFEGFGGALTESAAYALNHLAEKDRQQVIAGYFDPVIGHGYTIARTHMNSCDFSLGNYAVADTPGDIELKNFDMSRVDEYLAPYLKAIQKCVGKPYRLMITPWSPPAWMKTNGNMNHGGRLKPEYRSAWALYYARFVKELNNRGLNVWGVSIQNEPEAIQTWDSCIWTGAEEGEFAAGFLGPELEKHGLGDLKIFIWDHNRDRLMDRAKDSLEIPGASKYIHGIAYHWYTGANYENVCKVSQAYPDKYLFLTEACVEGGPRPGAWFTGERYAHNIINDLNQGCQGWIDWNLALDEQGGPNHAKNYCDAPVLVDTKAGTFSYQSSYYYLGHFSRYIRPGSIRIGLELVTGMVPAAADGVAEDFIEACAFRTENGGTTVVVLNRTEAELHYSLDSGEKAEKRQLTCPARGIQTLVFRQ